MGNFQLQTGSPCINSGNPDTTGLELPEYDYYNNPRIVNSIIDMGASGFQGASIPAPANITISVSADTVYITWDAVPGASAYKVYSSNQPQSGFTEDLSGSFRYSSWSANISEVKKFYYVTAIDERPITLKQKYSPKKLR